MDEETRALLMDWDLPQLIPTFEEQEIDISAFNHLTKELIQELIPKIGVRTKFLRKFLENQPKEDDGVSVLPATPSTCTLLTDTTPTSLQSASKRRKLSYDSPVSVTGEGIFSKDLKTYLQQSTSGNIILQVYSQNDHLNRQSRKSLVEIIITGVLNARPHSYKVKHHEWQELADKIKETFPSEITETYFIPPLTEGPSQKISKGKLVDRFRNTIRNLRLAGLENKKEKSFIENNSINIEEREELQQHAEWLRHTKTPWPEVIQHWTASQPLRGESSESKTVGDIIKEWPILRQPLGYTLLEKDFEIKFPGHELLLFANFEKVTEQLLCHFNAKETQSLEVLHLREKQGKGDCRDVCTMLLLASAIPPSVRCAKGKNKWKPTILESQEGFLLHVKTSSDIQCALQRKREKMKSLDLPVQPFVVIVGPTLMEITSFYVSIDDILYKLDSPLKALDICFKAIHVLHAEYAPEAIQVWMFIQKGVYEMTTKWDRQIPAVNAVLSEIKH